MFKKDLIDEAVDMLDSEIIKKGGDEAVILREHTLAKALLSVADECGASIEVFNGQSTNGNPNGEPLCVDSSGDYCIRAARGFGSAFASYLNASGGVRTTRSSGFGEKPVLNEQSKWCRLNHLAAERIVRAYSSGEGYRILLGNTSPHPK